MEFFYCEISPEIREIYEMVVGSSEFEARTRRRVPDAFLLFEKISIFE